MEASQSQLPSTPEMNANRAFNSSTSISPSSSLSVFSSNSEFHNSPQTDGRKLSSCSVRLLVGRASKWDQTAGKFVSSFTENKRRKEQAQNKQKTHQGNVTKRKGTGPSVDLTSKPAAKTDRDSPETRENGMVPLPFVHSLFSFSSVLENFAAHDCVLHLGNRQRMPSPDNCCPQRRGKAQ
jgi:hypothetical protein